MALNVVYRLPEAPIAADIKVKIEPLRDPRRIGPKVRLVHDLPLRGVSISCEPHVYRSISARYGLDDALSGLFHAIRIGSLASYSKDKALVDVFLLCAR